MTISRKQLFGLLAILFLTVLLPLVVFMMKGRFDIRPRAVLSGAADFKLNADKVNLSPGETVNVLVSVALTDQSIKASGVDFSLLFDKKLEIESVVPVMGSFTDVVILDDSGSEYSGEGNAYNFVRLSMVSKKAKAELPGGTIALANVSLKASGQGSAKIKFPDDNTKLQVVGTN